MRDPTEEQQREIPTETPLDGYSGYFSPQTVAILADAIRADEERQWRAVWADQQVAK